MLNGNGDRINSLVDHALVKLTSRVGIIILLPILAYFASGYLDKQDAVIEKLAENQTELIINTRTLDFRVTTLENESDGE